MKAERSRRGGDINDERLLSNCDAILMLEGWSGSKGARREREYAIAHDIPVYYYGKPEQVEALDALLAGD